MEVYRNATNPTILLRVPDEVLNPSNKVDIFVIENGKKIYEFDRVQAIPSLGYQVALPWFLIRQDRDIYIHWDLKYVDPFDALEYPFKEQTYVQVVTPILSEEEIVAITGWNPVQQFEDIRTIERKVRHVIQSLTGQNFGKFYGKMDVSGNGSTKLMLPAPLLEFKGMLYDGVIRPNHNVRIINNGWGVSGGSVYIDNIKQAPPEWMLDDFSYEGKIRHPYAYGQNYFTDGVEYTIEGLWGYADVPADIRQAARLLVSDYSCDESLWRDRYIDSIRAGDWRFEFNAQAFEGTGNVQADQILAGYRRATMAVV